MVILHLSFDFPDDIYTDKTKAVKNLVDVQDKYENMVFSLNRTANPFSDFGVVRTDSGFAMKVFGLPYGIGLNTWMYFASKKVLKIIKGQSAEVKLIHAHKLTFEGVMAYWLSKWLSVPFISTIRGDSDLMVIKTKRRSRAFYGKILDETSRIIYLAPWTKSQMEKFFPRIRLNEKGVLLPNIIEPKQQVTPKVGKNNKRFISVFRLDRYKRKNIKRIIKAFDTLNKTFPEIGLDIIGPGSEKSKEIIQNYIRACDYPFNFSLLGPMSHDELLQHYKNYLGFVLPSNPETFGLVFIEALNAGLPIVYAKNAGVDGLFDEIKIGLKVESTSVHEIAEALKAIYLNNEDYVSAVQTFKEKGGLKKFSKREIGEAYVEALNKIT